MLIKGIHQKDNITLINTYAPKTRSSNFIKGSLLHLKSYIDPYTVIVNDFNTSLSLIKKSTRETLLTREIMNLNIIKQMIIIQNIPFDTKNYTFFSVAYETFSKLDQILGHKATLTRYRKIK